MKNSNFILLSISLLFLGCKHQNMLETHYPIFYDSKDDFGEGIYFQEIVDIEFSNNIFYFLDSELNKVFCTDNNFNFIASFIEEGGAEFEAKGLGHMAFDDEILFVTDNSQGKIMKFNAKREYLESSQIGLLGIGDFIVKNGKLYYFNDEYTFQESPLTVLNNTTKILNIR